MVSNGFHAPDKTDVSLEVTTQRVALRDFVGVY